MLLELEDGPLLPPTEETAERLALREGMELTDALRAALTEACNALHIVAADVNELSPHYDPTGASTAVACKIVRELLIGIRALG